MSDTKRLAALIEQLDYALVAADATGTVYLPCTPEELESIAADGTWHTYLHDAGTGNRFALDIYSVTCGRARVEAHRHREITLAELASLSAEPVRTDVRRSAFR